MKAEVYQIFTDIQTRSNTTENLESFVKIFEKNPVVKFNDVLENVFLIIIKNFEKNNVALKNIKEFIKSFMEKAIKISSSKAKDNLKKFIKHFCEFFTSNAKKHKYKTLCLYFLSKFLS